MEEVFIIDKDKVIEDIIETEEVVETHHNSQSRDFGWESLASVEQSRQNEIISEIYELMSNPDETKFKALKAEWESLPSEGPDSAVELRYQKGLETYDRRSEQIAVAINIKKDLVNRAEMLKDNENFQTTARELQDLQKKWREAGFAGKSIDQDLWTRFREANDYFFERRSKHFDEMNAQRGVAAELKEAIILEVEEIHESDDWKNTSRMMNELMNRWKKAGFAGREIDDELWARFNGPRQAFYARQSAHFDAMRLEQDKARAAKEKIIEEVRDILSLQNLSEHKAKMDAKFEEWKGAGHSGRENEASLWSIFKALQDEFFTNMKNEMALTSEERRNVMEEDLERLNVRIAALENLNDMIEIKLDTLENPSLSVAEQEKNKEEIEQLKKSKEDNSEKLDAYHDELKRIEKTLNTL